MKLTAEKALAVIGIGMCGVLGGALANNFETTKRTNEQVVAAAEDLGCTVIEQSYHHPENFYIDCGNDEIRIIKLEK